MTALQFQDCGWGTERCAEMVEESSWIWWLIANHPGALGFSLIALFVLWQMAPVIAEEYRRNMPNKKGP